MPKILLKLSGEQLAGNEFRGFDPERVAWIANQIKAAKESAPNTEFVVVVGAGNFVRGEYFASSQINRVTADNMGMLAIVINALGMADIFNACGLETVALSNIFAEQVIDSYTPRRALNHLGKGRVVIVAGGTGRPYFTSDMSAACIAMELGCDVVAKATKVDGVYDSDPAKEPDAKLLPEISFNEAITNDSIRVMDKAALALIAENHRSVIVFELLKDGNITKLAKGERLGSLVKENI